jgi:small subunit ribosomal protein S1
MSGKDPSNEDDFAALLAASEAEGGQHVSVAVGDVVRGQVIAVGQTVAFVALGGKVEASIDLAEFRDPESGEMGLAVGDQIEATVVDDGGDSGSVVLKRTLGRGGHVSAELEQALAHGIPVEGVVTGENKGGFDVQIGTARAFCPGSQIDYRRGPRVAGALYVGQRFRFRVIKIEGSGRNIVVSRRALLEDEAAQQAARLWETLQVGAVVRGTVTNLRDFGAFVDLGGVEGLIHIGELGYGRVEHPSEVLAVGQQVEVQVTKIQPPLDEEAPGGRRQIGLSLKALAEDPWATAAQRFPLGATVAGIVRRLESFGAFVELLPGVEGLAHISKLVLDRRIAHARQVLTVGQTVEVTILAVDPDKRRISLSMVEQARQARETAESSARAEEQAAVAKMNEHQSLGSFADLLAASKKRR